MSLLTETRVVGVSCDVRGCSHEHRLTKSVPYFSGEHDRFLALLLTEHWARRAGRSVTWFCPTHADRAGRCIKGSWGQCSPWCPVHRDGRVTTWDSEDERRLAGLDNILSRADRARRTTGA